jgi:hypothetical protein
MLATYHSPIAFGQPHALHCLKRMPFVQGIRGERHWRTEGPIPPIDGILQLYSTVFTMPFLCPAIFALQKKFGLSFLRLLNKSNKENYFTGTFIFYNIMQF